MTASTNCIFCRILTGELPAERVYEDEHTFAFLDISPVERGHTLVIPRMHCERITDVPPDLLGRVAVAVRTVADAIIEGLNAQGLNVTQANGTAAGQVVPHLHVHLIPRFERHGNPANWIPGRYGDDAERRAFAARIRDACKR